MVERNWDAILKKAGLYYTKGFNDINFRDSDDYKMATYIVFYVTKQTTKSFKSFIDEDFNKINY